MDSRKSVICPEVIKMLRNSVVQASWKRFFVCKSTQKCQPVPQTLRFILKTHFLLLVVDNFNDTTHNIGEENNSAKHVAYRYEDFSVALGVVVSIADGGKCCHGVVPAHNQSFIDGLAFHVKLIPES
tara:strand:+ start:245 stop:625 length:381 start_codon:yes stop_codon:yes gene_type:complete